MRCACIHDLAGLGHCSLTAAIPILACMGIQPCPVPTAVLSSQTDGYSGYSYLDMTPELPAYIGHWKTLHSQFDGIFTGFLGSQEQLSLIEDFLRSFPDALKVVDPVMGDDGAAYDTYNAAMCAGMGRLAGIADVITPNLTEAAILLGMDYADAPHDPDGIAKWASGLSREIAPRAVITGVPSDNRTKLFIAASERGNTSILEKPLVAADTPCKGSYPGTGDVFASVLTASLLRGDDLVNAANRAADFVSDCVEYTASLETPRCEGLQFEPLLKNLVY